MMEFVLLTAAIVLGILVATAIMIVIMMQPFVMKAYMKWVCKKTGDFVGILDENNQAEDL